MGKATNRTKKEVVSMSNVSTYVFNGKDVTTYECSTKGDKGFSPYYCKVEITFTDGKKETKSIEHWYHTLVKGYGSIKEGKGKPGRTISRDAKGVYQEVRKDFTLQQVEYFGLWGMYFEQNPEELKRAARLLAKGYMFKDSYARSTINQAAAITYHASIFLAQELVKCHKTNKELIAKAKPAPKKKAPAKKKPAAKKTNVKK